MRDAFKKSIAEFIRRIEKEGHIIMVGKVIEIKYATSKNDSRAFIFIRDTDKTLATINTEEHYLEMLDEHWYVEIVYYARD